MPENHRKFEMTQKVEFLVTEKSLQIKTKSTLQIVFQLHVLGKSHEYMKATDKR